MAADLSALQTAVANLQAAVLELKPAVDAAQELATRAIAKLQELADQIAALEPNAQAIADLAASVGTTVTTLSTEATEQAERNAALQTKLDELTPPT